MKVLVTGGAGFLGSHIVHALLRRGDKVVVLDHRLRGKCLSGDILDRVQTFEVDVCEDAGVRRAVTGCGIVFHCAAMVGVDTYSENPAKTMEVEEAGLRSVCRAALSARGTRVIYASSSAVYGTAGGDVGLNEALPVTPVSNYGIAKRFNELYLASQYLEQQLSSVSLRIFNIYGPRQDERLVIPRFIRQALAGKDIEIFGDGLQTRDFVYVDDVVATALKCGAGGAGCDVVNVCSGQETTILDLAKKIVRLTKSSSKIVLLSYPAKRAAFEVPRCFGSRKKLQQILGEVSPISIDDGLARTIASITAA